jgi:predicted PurR-regulated permease PerM
LIGALVFVWMFINRNLVLSIATPFLVAAAIAYAINPVINFLTKHGTEPFIGHSGLVCIHYCGHCGSFRHTASKAGRGNPQPGHAQLPELTSEWYEGLAGWYRRHRFNSQLHAGTLDDLVDYLDLQSIRDWLVGSAGTFVQRITGWISSLVLLIVIPVLTFYFLKDGDKICASIRKMIPPGSRHRIFPVARDIDGVLGGFIRGQLIIAAFVGVTSIIALLLIGVDYAILIGVIAGIANIVPYLGPIIGGSLAVLFALLISPFRALLVIVVFIGIQQIEGNILEPIIFGNQVGLHPVLVVLALLAGGSLGGILGLLIAVPTAAVIRVVLLAIINWFREKYPRYFET